MGQILKISFEKINKQLFDRKVEWNDLFQFI